MEYYIGMDIHKDFTVAVAKDIEGNELACDKFDNTKRGFKMFLRTFPAKETEIVIESTSVWEYIYDLLEELGYKTILANPFKTRAIAEARIKTDIIDASTLADLLRANLVAQCYIPKKEIRNLREIMRQRKSIVKGQTKMINKIRAVLTKNGIKLPNRTLCESSMQWIYDEIKEFTVKSVLVSYINLYEQYKFENKRLGEKIKEIALQDQQAEILMTIPGIAHIRAMEILSEIGEIERFKSSEKLCSYAGLVPGVKQSGTTIRYGRLIKSANKIIKTALIESSWTAIRTKETNSLQEHYKRLVRKKGKQKAICATARKMCCIIYAMLKKNQTFML